MCQRDWCGDGHRHAQLPMYDIVDGFVYRSLACSQCILHDLKSCMGGQSNDSSFLSETATLRDERMIT